MSVKLGDESFDECVDEHVETSTIMLRKPFYDTREFSVDTVLGRDATQAETYEAVAREVVDDVLEGFNGTILAYVRHRECNRAAATPRLPPWRLG